MITVPTGVPTTPPDGHRAVRRDAPAASQLRGDAATEHPIRAEGATENNTLSSESDRQVLRSFARRIDPSDAGAHNNLGVLYYNKALYEEAVSAFMRALELDPRMQVAQRNLEISYHNTGYYDRRVAELQERLRQTPDEREPRWELGRTYAILGDYEDAVAEFEELLAHASHDVAAMIQLGLAEKSRGRLEVATEWFLRAAEQEPDAVLSRRGLLQPRPE